MIKMLRAAVLSAVVLLPATARAQAHGEPFVLVTLNSGGAGYVDVQVGICYNRPLTTYYFTYNGNDISSYMHWGTGSGTPSWCSSIYPDPTYEEWHGTVPELCGQNAVYAQAIDNQVYAGDDSKNWIGSCLFKTVAAATDRMPALRACLSNEPQWLSRLAPSRMTQLKREG